MAPLVPSVTVLDAPTELSVSVLLASTAGVVAGSSPTFKVALMAMLPPVSSVTLPVVVVVVTFDDTVKSPALALPMTTLPAVMFLSSALETASVSVPTVRTSAPPTSILVPAVLF